MSLLELASSALVLAGAAFAFTGGVGLFRFPDFYSRTHAAGITDSAGAGLLLLGLMLQVEDFATAVRLALIMLFLLFTSPTATHALARSAQRDGIRPLLGGKREP